MLLLLVGSAVLGVLLVAVIWTRRQKKEINRLTTLIREIPSGRLDDPEREATAAQVLAATQHPTLRAKIQALVDDYQQRFLNCKVEVTLIAGDEQIILTTQEVGPACDSYCQYTISAGTTLEIKDSQEAVFLQDNPHREDVRSYLGHPLYVNGFKVGGCCAFCPTPRQWTNEEKKEIFAMSARVSSVIESAVPAANID